MGLDSGYKIKCCIGCKGIVALGSALDWVPGPQVFLVKGRVFEVFKVIRGVLMQEILVEE